MLTPDAVSTVADERAAWLAQGTEASVIAALPVVDTGVTHTTELPNGSFHETTTVTESVTFVPDDPSQPTYTGHATFWDGENSNTKTFTATPSPRRSPATST